MPWGGDPVEEGRRQREWTADWGPRARVWWAAGRNGTTHSRGLALVLDEKLGIVDAPLKPNIQDDEGKLLAVAVTLIGDRKCLFIVSHAYNAATVNAEKKNGLVDTCLF